MLVVVRIVVLFLLLIGTLIFGTLPICLRPYLSPCKCSVVHRRGCKSRFQRVAVCFLIFFGGGVLLATCLVHLLHEARQGFEEALAKCLDVDANSAHSDETDTALTDITTMPILGTLEYKNITRPFQSVLEKEPVYDSVLCSTGIVKSLFPLPEFITMCGFFLIYFVEELIKSFIRMYQSFDSLTVHSFDVNKIRSQEFSSSLGRIRQLTELDTITAPNAENKIGCASEAEIDSRVDRNKSINDLNLFYGHTDIEEIKAEGLEDFVTVLALSFNSVFEGFAAGFQHTEISTWMLFISLALHKFVSAFVVSLETLHNGGSKIRVSIYMVLFSLMCPVGMMAAILTHSNLVESGSLQIGVLNALSVGTLLYVTFYEMLRQRRDFEEISGFVQLFILLLGFATMSSVEYFYTRVE